MDKNVLVLVDQEDRELGLIDKIEAHQKGLLHRAISVCVFNSKKEMLLQRRAMNKYHSAGLWTNACCSHPYPNEQPVDAAKRRLKEEMGISIDSFRFLFGMVYKAELDNNLYEHEYDHVFVGFSDSKPIANSEEVADWKYLSMDVIEKNIKQSPQEYTVWFNMIIEKIKLNLEFLT